MQLESVVDVCNVILIMSVTSYNTCMHIHFPYMPMKYLSQCCVGKCILWEIHSIPHLLITEHLTYMLLGTVALFHGRTLWIWLLWCGTLLAHIASDMHCLTSIQFCLILIFPVACTPLWLMVINSPSNSWFLKMTGVLFIVGDRISVSMWSLQRYGYTLCLKKTLRRNGTLMHLWWHFYLVLGFLYSRSVWLALVFCHAACHNHHH